MKQRTPLEVTNLLPVSRPLVRRRLLAALRPEGALVPLDLSLIEVVADLDPGMVDWTESARSKLSSGSIVV